MSIGAIVGLISYVLEIAIRFAEILVFVRCLLSFFPDWNNAFTAFIFTVTEPMLKPCRKILDRLEFTRRLPVDLSPILLFILLGLFRYLMGMVLALIIRIVGLFI